MLKQSILNILIRMSTLASRFILLFFLAKFITPSELGIYGLFQTTISISIFLLGMDFYIYSNREMLKNNKDSRGVFLRDQFIFYLIVYVISLPLLFIIFLTNIIDYKYLFFFYLILILEHLSQELNRLYIAISRSILANILLFLKSGIWVYILIIIMLYSPEFRKIEYILSGWIMGLICSFLIGIVYLKDINWKNVYQSPINWSWIWKGFKLSLPFLSSSLALKSLEFSDRFFLKNFYGDAEVGVYTFFINITNVIPVFVFSGIISIYFPKMIEKFSENKHKQYNQLVKKMTLGTIFISIIIGISLVTFISPILSIINKEIYLNNIQIFYILVISSIINVFSLIPHYILYSKNFDSAIIKNTFICSIIGLLFNVILIPKFGLLGAALTNLISFSLLLLLKFSSAIRHT